MRQSARGLLAWDVDHLIARTRDLQPVEVPLAAIGELDDAYWYQDEGAVPTCRSIVEHLRLIWEADLAFPIILDPEGRVMDGMHRAARALLEGCTHLRAYRLTELPPPDYVDVDLANLPYDD